MDAISTYSTASLAWLSAQALPLIVWPSLVSTLLQADASPTQGAPQYTIPHSSLEQYFARSLGLSQLALGSLLLVVSGALPLNSLVEKPESTPSPYASATVLVSALYHSTTAFYSYTRYHATGQLAYLFGCLGASVLAVAGLWTLMFAGEHNKRVSRRTGADKSTSGWPFKNTEADRRKRR